MIDEDQSFSGTCPTCGQRYLVQAERDRDAALERVKELEMLLSFKASSAANSALAELRTRAEVDAEIAQACRDNWSKDLSVYKGAYERMARLCAEPTSDESGSPRTRPQHQ